MVILSFLGLLPRVLLGLCLTHLIWDTYEPKHLPIKLFLASIVGFGISSLLSFLWIWVGLSLFSYALVESISALILTAWVLYQNREKLPAIKTWLAPVEKSNWLWLVFLIAGSLLFVFDLIVVSVKSPHGLMDAWTNWNVVARIIYLGGSNWQLTFQRHFDHPDYPLFMSITNALTWSITKKDSIWGPIDLHFLISLSTVGLLFALVNALRDFKQATLVTVLFVAQPFTAYMGMSQLADFPLAYIILAIGGLTLLYFQTKATRLLILIGFLAGLAAWTKNEGAMIGVTCAAGWGIYGWFKDRPALKNFLVGIALPLVVVILFKIFLAPSNNIVANGGQNLFQKITDMTRYLTIFKMGGEYLWNLGGGTISLIAILAIYMVIVGKAEKSTAGLWFVGAIVIVQLASYFVIYLITPHDLVWHIKTSCARLYAHVLPLTLLWIFTWTASPQELFLPKG